MLLQKYGKLDCHERRIWRCLYAICFRLAWARKRRLSVTTSAAWRRLVGSKSCTLDLNILRENSLPGPDMLAERSLKSRRPLSARSRETGRKGGGQRKEKKKTEGLRANITSEAQPLLHGSPMENMRGCRRGRKEAAAAVVVVVIVVVVQSR